MVVSGVKLNSPASPFAVTPYPFAYTSANTSAGMFPCQILPVWLFAKRTSLSAKRRRDPRGSRYASAVVQRFVSFNDCDGVQD